MLFDSFTLESAFFFSLVTILASLPTDPYFQPWQSGAPSHRTCCPDTQWKSTGNQFFYRPPLRDWAYPRGQHNPQAPHSEFEAPQNHRRRSDPFPGDDPDDWFYVNVGEQSIGTSYSSHVNYGEADQKGRAGKTPKNIRDDVEPVLRDKPPGRADKRINPQTGSRNVRTGADRKQTDVYIPRIVTPKRDRRPERGSATKNQNKTNTISTTEKTFRNETRKSPTRSRPRPQGGDIVFPDGYVRKFVPSSGACPRSSTFCENLNGDYPRDYISQVLKVHGAKFWEFFGQDTISDPNITERINAPEENSLCPYRQEVIFPKAAQNKEDKWLFIINQDQYVQGVTVEICLNPDSRCILTEGFPLGYIPYCKQKYIERRLVALGEDGKPHSDSFKLPSCCSCVVKHENLARMGAPQK